MTTSATPCSLDTSPIRLVLDLVLPRLRPGSVVIADNIFTFKRELRPYVERMQSGASGFDSMTVAIGQGLEYSVFRG